MLFTSLRVDGNVEASVMPVVCEFTDVFPKDICDLPPEREFEFTINLAPDTRLMSMAPYRIYALEDLLENKFV